MNSENEFTYKYSSEEQKEIERIRRKYSEPENSRLDELHRLDRCVNKAGTFPSLFVGIFGTLLFGLGMCCILEWSDRYFALGIIIGIFGLAFITAAHPLNNFLVKRKRKELAPRILQLADELSDI